MKDFSRSSNPSQLIESLETDHSSSLILSLFLSYTLFSSDKIGACLSEISETMELNII